jgi:hypothetical protein
MAASAARERLLAALGIELSRQDRTQWHAALGAGISTSGDGAAEAGGGPTVAINLSYLEVDDPVVVAVMEALLRIAVTVRDVAWSVSLRGNDKVTNASSASFALALATVSGIRSVDLTGTAMTVDGLRTMLAAVSRLAVKPEVVLPNGEHFDADSSLAGGSSSLNAAAAAGVAAGTATTTTTTATGPKPRGAAGTGVVGLRASHSSSSTGSAVDLNALRKRRDELFRQENVESIDEARKEAARLEAKLTNTSSSVSHSAAASPNREGRRGSTPTKTSAAAAADAASGASARHNATLTNTGSTQPPDRAGAGGPSVDSYPISAQQKPQQQQPSPQPPQERPVTPEHQFLGAGPLGSRVVATGPTAGGAGHARSGTSPTSFGGTPETRSGAGSPFGRDFAGGGGGALVRDQSGTEDSSEPENDSFYRLPNPNQPLPNQSPQHRVLQRQMHPARRQKLQQHGHGHPHPLPNPNMISSATVAVQHQRNRSVSTTQSGGGGGNASPLAGPGALVANAATSMSASAMARMGRGRQSVAAGATGAIPNMSMVSASTATRTLHGTTFNTFNIEESAAASPRDHTTAGHLGDVGSSAAEDDESLLAGGSDDDETTPTEMPDRQDDIDIMQNLAPTDSVLNLCQAHPTLDAVAILDPTRLRNITVLNIAQNCLTELRHLPPSLMRLDASGNAITDLGDALMNCRLLVVLNLRRNYITKISGLERCLALKHLFLGRNGIQRIAGVGHILGLETLDVSYNRLRTDGALRALSQNTSLLHLILYGNPVAMAKKHPAGMRGILRNLVPSLVAVDNERLPFPTAAAVRGGRAGVGAGLAGSPTPPPRTSAYDDRSSFLGVQERIANMSVSDRGLKNLNAALQGSDTSVVQRSHLHNRSDINVSNITTDHANKSLAIAAAVLNKPSSAALAAAQMSAVTGYSARERQEASMRAMNLRAAGRQIHSDPLSLKSIQKTRHHLTRTQLQRLVELHNATLIERSIADRIADDQRDAAGTGLVDNDGVGEGGGGGGDGFAAGVSEADPLSPLGHTLHSHSHSPNHAGNNKAAVSFTKSADPFIAIPTTDSSDHSVGAGTGRGGHVFASPRLDDAAADAWLTGDIARDAFMRNVQVSDALHARAASFRTPPKNTASPRASASPLGLMNSASPRGLLPPSTTAAPEQDFTHAMGRSNSRGRFFSPGSDNARLPSVGIPGSPKANLAAAAASGVAVGSGSWRMPQSASPIRSLEEVMLSPDGTSAHHQQHLPRVGGFYYNHNSIPDDDALRHVHFSPIDRQNRTTDISATGLATAAVVADMPGARRSVSGGMMVGLGLTPASIRVCDLVDAERDPPHIQEWIERLDQDDRATHLALRTVLVVLEHEPALQSRASSATRLTPDGQRCVDVIEKNQLAEDMELPAEVADYFDFTEEELNGTSAVSSSAPSEHSGAYRTSSGRRARLLEALRRISENKTCLRYIVALVNGGRFEVVSRFVERTRARSEF